MEWICNKSVYQEEAGVLEWKMRERRGDNTIAYRCDFGSRRKITNRGELLPLFGRDDLAIWEILTSASTIPLCASWLFYVERQSQDQK